MSRRGGNKGQRFNGRRGNQRRTEDMAKLTQSEALHAFEQKIALIKQGVKPPEPVQTGKKRRNRKNIRVSQEDFMIDMWTAFAGTETIKHYFVYEDINGSR